MIPKVWYAHFWRDSTGTGCLVEVEAVNAAQAMRNAKRVMSDQYVGWRMIGLYTASQVDALIDSI